MGLARSSSDIDDQINLAYDYENPFPGMTYTQGVAAALEWVRGDSDDKPLDADELASL